MKKQTTHSKNRLEIFNLMLHQKQVKKEKHYFDYLLSNVLAKFFNISLLILMMVLPSLVKAQITLLQDYQNNTSAAIGSFIGVNFREAGFSGLFAIAGTNGKEFWTVSDRGVNVDCANANPAGCHPTYDKMYGFPNYTPKIHRIKVNGDSIQILQTITIKNPNGINVTGIINPTGLGSTASEVASTDTVLDCANFNLKIAAKDTFGIDSEGILVDKYGNFWLCEEGGPTIWKVNSNGVVLNRFTPYANLPGVQGVDILIDTVFKYRKNNRGFEGIAMTPNGKIYAIIQSPILYPTLSVGENTRVHRILEIDPSNNSTRMLVYLNDGIIGASGPNQIRLRDWKMGDMAAINDSTFLVLEAALRGTTDIKRMYLININQATNVNSGLYSGVTLEALVDSTGLANNGITPVKKTLFMNLLANGWPASLDKAEGLAILNDSTIAIGNDNDYGQTCPLANGIPIATTNLSHLITYSLQGSNKLQNYQPAIPAINHTPLANTTSGGPFSVVATIIDNLTITSAQLNYKVNGIAKTPLTPSSVVGNIYTFNIPAQIVAGVISYNIQATDASAFVFYSTGSGSTYHTFTFGPTFNSVDLSSYVRIGRYDLPEPTRTTPPLNSLLCQEASAVTYNWDTQTLFVIGDGSTSVVQVSKTGDLINSMTLALGGSPQGTEFYDTEGLTYIGNGQFVLVEERDRQAVLFTYVPGTTLIRSATQTVKLGTTIGNIGLEGLSYDPYSGGYVFVKEATPQGIFQTGINFGAGTATNGSPTTVNSIDLFNPTLTNLADFADVFSLSNLSALTGQTQESNLLILSQESGKIINISRTGTIANSLTIMSDTGNLLSVADQQHEGFTMDNNGMLYTVSENGGGDFDHPQLWVYARSIVPNQAPTAIILNNEVDSILENTSTASAIKVADIVLTDDGLGSNNLYLSGSDTAFFQITNSQLFIKPGTVLDFETKPSYSIAVNVDDPSVGINPDATIGYTLTVINIVNEIPTAPAIIISEVAPWSSGNSPISADWFEVTNTGNSAVNISGWKVDDNSNSFASAALLNGITSIGPGESVIFIETANPVTLVASFKTLWFGANPPAGLQIGSYTGSGLGLGTGGDAVNLYNASGSLEANVVFGNSPTVLYRTFDNSNGLNNATISQLSVIGVRGAFIATNDVSEIGSPGTAGKLFISEVAPWSSGNSPVGADWFEVTNGRGTEVDITGWKIDDNSGSFAAAVSLSGITSIAPGESVIFMETNDLAGKTAAFKSLWFGANPPAMPRFGNYTGSGVGLGTSGDAVNLYTSGGFLMCNVAFGVSPGSPFPTFDNAAGLNNATISLLSSVGVNGAFKATNDLLEIGSPGVIINPEVSVSGNSVNISDGTTILNANNNTNFGTIVVGSTISKSFVVSNAGPGSLTVSGVNFTGIDSSKFSLLSAPTFPLNIVSGGTLTLTVAYAPVASGIHNATIHIMNTDTDESDFDFAIQGTSTCNEILLSATTTDLQCHGELEGEIDLNVNGSVGPYSYLWNNGSTNQDLINLAAGSYSVMVTDLYGCSATASFSITQPTSVSLTSSVSNNNCNGNSAGAIDLTAIGGTPGYAYLWEDFSTDEDRSGLEAGIYTVIVFDANNCSSTVSATVSQPAAISISGIVMPGCKSTANGSINITVSGGSSAYSYHWNNGSTSEDISGLVGGSYTVTVTDSHSCTGTSSFAVVKPASLLLNGSHTNIKCGGKLSGIATSIPVGGLTPYSFLWNTGSTTSSITNLAAGTYTVTVTDAAGCSKSMSITNTQNPILTVTVAPSGNTATATPGGGVAPYTYYWKTSPNQSTQTAVGLLAGTTYKVLVTDSKGCTVLGTITMPLPRMEASDISINTIKVYPNPSNGLVAVNFSSEMGKIRLRLTDVYGRVVYINENENVNGTLLSKDFSNVAKGIYNLEISDDGQAVVFKLLIQ